MLTTDLVDIPLDPNTGEIVFTNGKIILTSGPDAVTQGIRLRMQEVKGEWFLDLDSGIPYYERDGVPATEAIFGQRYSQVRALQAYRNAILSTPGVVELLQLAVTFDVKTRKLSVSWQVRTSFGDTPSDSIALGK